jgi:hypothetical protein
MGPLNGDWHGDRAGPVAPGCAATMHGRRMTIQRLVARRGIERGTVVVSGLTPGPKARREAALAAAISSELHVRLCSRHCPLTDGRRGRRHRRESASSGTVRQDQHLVLVNPHAS